LLLLVVVSEVVWLPLWSVARGGGLVGVLVVEFFFVEF